MKLSTTIHAAPPMSGPGLRRTAVARAPAPPWPRPAAVAVAAFSLAAAVALTACAGGPAAVRLDAPALDTQTPAAWQAPLPHDGQAIELARWWQQFNDPVLSLLIESAQGVSPSVAAARSRIEQSRAAGVAARAAMLPTLGATASASRGQQDLSLPLGTSTSAGLQAGWEFDLFGGNRAGADAAQARLQGAAAAWHEARVSVAAEVAGQYTAYRACEAQLAQVQLDATSRAETSRLTELAARSGFQAPANAALARASAAQGNSLLTQQRAQCESGVKALVSLTALAEADLRRRLAAGAARLPQPAQIAVASVPAQALAQRPDVYSAERELLAARADVAQSSAQRYPRIALSGSIGAARFSSGAATLDGTVWSLGPVTVSLPLFDGGVRRANVVAAQARYDEAAAAYAGKLRGAVREVEEALIALQSTADRSADAQLATEGFGASYVAVQARYQGGLASLFELEDARRTAVQAQGALIELQRERVAAWISLYRALGGGWSAAQVQTGGVTDAEAAQAAGLPLQGVPTGVQTAGASHAAQSARAPFNPAPVAGTSRAASAAAFSTSGGAATTN